MTALLILLFGAGIPPVPKEPVPVLAIAPIVETIDKTLVWNATPTPNCSYKLYSWTNDSTAFVTNSWDIGTNLFRTVHLYVGIEYRFYVTAVSSNGVESLPSNSIRYPGQKILEGYFWNDGKEQKLISFTNTPPGSVGNLHWHQWEDYSL